MEAVAVELEEMDTALMAERIRGMALQALVVDAAVVQKVLIKDLGTVELELMDSAEAARHW
jgi:predicted MarR family transcription regulator